jgi:hypothetical protein
VSSDGGRTEEEETGKGNKKPESECEMKEEAILID